jgi:hypothetical protein
MVTFGFGGKILYCKTGYTYDMFTAILSAITHEPIVDLFNRESDITGELPKILDIIYDAKIDMV